MKARRQSRDTRENRAERQEKLGSACDTLPATTLAEQTGASRHRALTRAGPEIGTRALTPTSPDVCALSALKSGPVAATEKTLVTLRLAAKDAVQVMIAGSFSDWKPERMSRGANGSGDWKANLRLRPGRYEYRFIVDGTWTDDPNATEFVWNGFGSRNAVLVVSG